MQMTATSPISPRGLVSIEGTDGKVNRLSSAIAAANAISCAAKTRIMYPIAAAYDGCSPPARRAACSARKVKDVKTPMKPAWKAIHVACSRVFPALVCNENVTPAKKAPLMLSAVAEISISPVVTIGQQTEVRLSASAPHARVCSRSGEDACTVCSRDDEPSVSPSLTGR
eukprot:scaffold262960_cov35-Tisochrysis_lutea.AAC.1